MEEIHRSHEGPGPLELKNYTQIYKCNGCKELGTGSRYSCEQCDFNLHRECMLPKCETDHALFKRFTFYFFARLPRDEDGRIQERICKACGKPVTGFAYLCQENDMCLHPFCHSLPSRLQVDDVQLWLFDAALSTSKCLWCKKKWLGGSNPTVSGNISGWSYVSTCKKYHFHVHCCNEMMLENRLEFFIRGFSVNTSSSSSNMDMAMMLVITNVVLELLSVVLDQISSINKLRCALFAMLISFAALFTSIFEVIHEARKGKLIWSWKGTLPLPWCYFRDRRQKPFGTFKDMVGLVCAFGQCLVATMSYCFLRKHADNPIKISVFSIIFAFGLLFSQILKNRERQNQVSEGDQMTSQMSKEDQMPLV